MLFGIVILSFVLLPVAPAQESDDSVSIRGLRTLSEAEARALIENQLDYIATHGLSTARADDAAFFLERELRQRGYEDARVAWEMTSPSRVVLNVNEGGGFILAEVISQGNQVLTDEALFELITTDTRKRLDLGLDDPIPYVVKDVEAGRDHVKDYYELLGYIAANVTLDLPETDPDPPGGRVVVELRIDEGRLYRVGELMLGQPPEPALEDAFAEVALEYENETFSPSMAGQLEARLRDVARDAGYFQAVVQVEAQDSVARDTYESVDLVATADYGRKFFVEGFNLSGNTNVRDRFFEGVLDELTGRPYDPEKTNEVVGKMLRTGAFIRVTASPKVADDEAGLVELDVDIVEAKSRDLGIYGGFGSYEGPILGFDYVDRNLFGLVRRFDARLESSLRGLTGEVTYTNPWFFWTDWKASLGWFSRTRLNEGYDKLETGFRGELSRDIGERQRVSVFAQSSYTDIYDADIEESFLGDRHYVDSFVGISYEIDWRDDKAIPRRGGYLHVSNSLASTVLGGEFTYMRSDFRWNYHIPIGGTTLHLGANASALISLGGDDLLPIDLRLFQGGARSVRSFPERELGPEDPGDYPVGGEFSTTFNAEYEIPLVSRLSLAIFADAGNLLFDFSEAGLNDMHYAGGLGFRFNSPLGPLRIDYGHNLNRDKGEPTGTFHIGFGSAF